MLPEAELIGSLWCGQFGASCERANRFDKLGERTLANVDLGEHQSKH